MRKRLYADKGKKLTDGIDFYGDAVDLAADKSEADFYEITEEEYEKIMEEREQNDGDLF